MGLLLVLAGCAGEDLHLTLDAEHRISVGFGTACAIRDDGRVLCWQKEGLTPLKAPEGEFVQVSIGAEYGLALRPTGEIVSFGFAHGSVRNPPAGRYRRVEAGMWEHACALDVDGVATCWGGREQTEGTPTRALSAIDGGIDYTAALDEKGRILTWGRTPPPRPSGVFVDVAAGLEVTCGVTEDGRIACAPAQWPGSRTLIVPPDGDGWVRLRVGETNACALHEDGHLGCWGRRDSFGELGLDRGPSPPPHDEVVDFAAGSLATCAMMRDGTVGCWGSIAAPPPGF
ncbi:MAG: hypothetical protein H6738_20735 [Alphaproteobacteria bacterium]|nr:hypothetical protein [Alphaproteobacteria bacterium]MCB9699219.1 hypothetical protein [Alphaproteobacteria bacterium]